MNNSIDKEIAHIRAMLSYKRWERELKDLPQRKREMILRGYGIRCPKYSDQNITFRALKEGTL